MFGIGSKSRISGNDQYNRRPTAPDNLLALSKTVPQSAAEPHATPDPQRLAVLLVVFNCSVGSSAPESIRLSLNRMKLSKAVSGLVRPIRYKIQGARHRTPRRYCA